MLMKLSVLALVVTLATGTAVAGPPPAHPDPRDAQIAELQKQVTEANQKGAYWMQIALALQKQRNAALDADAQLIAFPQPAQPQGPHQ